jgi:hypothetical protein
MASLHWSDLVLRLSRPSHPPQIERRRRTLTPQTLARAAAVGLTGGVALVGLFGILTLVAGGASSASVPPPVPASSLSAAIEANLGQAPRAALFLARGDDFQLLLAPREVRLQPPGTCVAETCSAFRLRFLGSFEPQLRGLDPLPQHARYRGFMGAGSINAPTFGNAVYEGLYPGIDLRFAGYSGELQYVFQVDRGADPSSIRFEIAGADRVRVDDAGRLTAVGKGMMLRQDAPFAFQIRNREQTPVLVWYTTPGARQVGLDVGAYDVRWPLVIRCGRAVLTAH